MLFKLTRQNMTFRTMIYIIRAKTFRTRKNFPGSNATLLPGFLGLWDDGLCLWVLSKRWYWINDKLYIYFYVNIWYRTIIDSWWLMVDMIWRRDLLDVPEQLDEGAAEGPLAHLTGNLKKNAAKYSQKSFVCLCNCIVKAPIMQCAMRWAWTEEFKKTEFELSNQFLS